MSPRTGRPKAEKPKTNIIRVRLDDEETARLDKYCAARDLTRADALRQGLEKLLLPEK